MGYSYENINSNASVAPIVNEEMVIAYVYSPYPILYISYGADKENLFNNQELLQLLVIYFILVTLMCDLWVIL